MQHAYSISGHMHLRSFLAKISLLHMILDFDNAALLYRHLNKKALIFRVRGECSVPLKIRPLLFRHINMDFGT